jgi:hypothetical protein
LSAAYSPLLVLTWTDRRPRPAWCLLCLCLLLAIAEVAARGYGLYALLALPFWVGVACAGMPAARYHWKLEIQGSQCWLSSTPRGALAPIAITAHSVLLSRVCVLQWIPLGSQRRQSLWLWAADFSDADYRALRRWWLVQGRR